MQHFLVQIRQPELGWAELEQLTARIRDAATELQRAGTDVRFARVVFVPDEDAVFLLYEASSEVEVIVAAERAGLRVAAVTPAIPTVIGGPHLEGAA